MHEPAEYQMATIEQHGGCLHQRDRLSDMAASSELPHVARFSSDEEVFRFLLVNNVEDEKFSLNCKTLENLGLFPCFSSGIFQKPIGKFLI